MCVCFFFSSRRRHTRFSRDWSSDVCSSDLAQIVYSCPVWPPCDKELQMAFDYGSIGLGIKNPFRLEGVVIATRGALQRSEERRVGKSVDLGGRGRMSEKTKRDQYRRLQTLA